MALSQPEVRRPLLFEASSQRSLADAESARHLAHRRELRRLRSAQEREDALCVATRLLTTLQAALRFGHHQRLQLGVVMHVPAIESLRRELDAGERLREALRAGERQGVGPVMRRARELDTDGA